MLDCNGWGAINNYNRGRPIVVHLQIVILVGIIALGIAPAATALTVAEVTTTNEAKDIMPEVG